MVYNHPVPLMYPISGCMDPGRIVKLKGITTPGCEKFIVNLQSSRTNSKKDDIPFHMSFRFNEQTVVRNHHEGGQWGCKEEREGGLPIAKGESFELLVTCKPEKYEVTLNGKFFCEFIHRLPYKRATHFSVYGDVHVELVGFVFTQPAENGMDTALARVYSREFSSREFPGNRWALFPGNQAREKSRTREIMFVINLQCGPSPEQPPYDDIVFHMHFRFFQQCIVRNHRSADKWGQEELEGGIPLKEGLYFELQILCEPRAFKVFINGKLFCQFAHRLVFSRITHLTAAGDVRIDELSWKDEKLEEC